MHHGVQSELFRNTGVGRAVTQATNKVEVQGQHTDQRSLNTNRWSRSVLRIAKGKMGKKRKYG